MHYDNQLIIAMLTPNDWLLQTVLDYYKQHPQALNTVHDIANHLFIIPNLIHDPDKERPDKKLSVRVVNWFVSNYAKQHTTAYSIFRNEKDASAPAIFSCDVTATPPTPDYHAERFIVWTQYCSAKRGYVSKDMFDPYCRRARIAVQRPDGSLFNTTLGQLNFFKWAIQNHIIDYISAYYDDIVRDMGARLTAKNARILAEEDADRPPGTRKKREELSVAACRTLKTISLAPSTSSSSSSSSSSLSRPTSPIVRTPSPLLVFDEPITMHTLVV